MIEKEDAWYVKKRVHVYTVDHWLKKDDDNIKMYTCRDYMINYLKYFMLGLCGALYSNSITNIHGSMVVDGDPNYFWRLKNKRKGGGGSCSC